MRSPNRVLVPSRNVLGTLILVERVLRVTVGLEGGYEANKKRTNRKAEDEELEMVLWGLTDWHRRTGSKRGVQDGHTERGRKKRLVVFSTLLTVLSRVLFCCAVDSGKGPSTYDIRWLGG